jgi:hypothetical protein
VYLCICVFVYLCILKLLERVIIIQVEVVEEDEKLGRGQNQTNRLFFEA